MRRVVLLLCVLSTLSVFGFGQKRNQYTIAPIFNDMRNLILNLKPEEIKFQSNDDNSVFAVLFECGLNDAAYSMRCTADGSISIFFTTGAGIIGAGEHPDARAEGLKLLQLSNKSIMKTKRTVNNDLPLPGYVRFYFRTKKGNYYYEEKESNISSEKSKFYALYYQAQLVIAKIREYDEKREK
jgi:hypothetical protein